MDIQAIESRLKTLNLSPEYLKGLNQTQLQTLIQNITQLSDAVSTELVKAETSVRMTEEQIGTIKQELKDLFGISSEEELEQIKTDCLNEISKLQSQILQTLPHDSALVQTDEPAQSGFRRV